MESNSLHEELYDHLETLPYQEQYVLVHTYGLKGTETLSNSEMAKHLHVTTASVINYRNRGLSKLKTDLAKWSS